MREQSRRVSRPRGSRRRRTGRRAWPRRLLLLALFVVAAWVLFRSGLGPRRPDTIVLHHSASSPVANGRPVDAAAIDAMHARRGFGTLYQGKVYHIGYHYVILPDGTVQPGRPEGCIGAHARHENDHSLGICLVGDFSSADNPRGQKGPTRPTRAQMAAARTLCLGLMRRYRIPPARVVRHRDVGQTACPGDRFPFASLQRSLRGQE